MLTRPLHHLRHNIVAYLALVAALGAGGGYALAATTTKTITVCADKSTGILHLHTRGRCKRDQNRVSWNQRGPTGPQGMTGATGPAGQAAPSAWAAVGNNGGTITDNGLSISHVSPGTYQVTVTAPACANKTSSPVVSVIDNPPSGLPAGAFPVAWLSVISPSQFTVYTGDVVGGSFSASDHSFEIQDVCSVP